MREGGGGNFAWRPRPRAKGNWPRLTDRLTDGPTLPLQGVLPCLTGLQHLIELACSEDSYSLELPSHLPRTTQPCPHAGASRPVMLSTSSSSSGPAAPHGADPLGDAIVTQGLDSQPLSVTSERTRHSTQEVDEALRGSLPPGKGKERHSEGQEQGEDEDEEDLVVYQASQGISSAKSSVGPGPSHVRRWSATLSNLMHPQQGQGRPPSPSLSNRSSLESVSFGFRDNLLPLSLSGDDDDEYEEDDRAEEGVGAGGGRVGQEYGDVEGAITAGAHGRHRVRRKRYKDPERRMGLIDGGYTE